MNSVPLMKTLLTDRLTDRNPRDANACKKGCQIYHILAQNYIGAEYQFAIFFIKNLVPYMQRQVLKINGAQCQFTGACFKIHTILIFFGEAGF